MVRFSRAASPVTAKFAVAPPVAESHAAPTPRVQRTSVVGAGAVTETVTRSLGTVSSLMTL